MQTLFQFEIQTSGVRTAGITVQETDLGGYGDPWTFVCIGSAVLHDPAKVREYAQALMQAAEVLEQRLNELPGA